METSHQKNLEEKIENENMTFSSVFKSMVPSVAVGTIAAAGCQELCSHYTSDSNIITSAGMAAQFTAGYGTYFATYFYANKDRLKENGKINWKRYGQEIGSVLLSDRIGNAVWAAAYGLTNGFCLKYHLDPSFAGTISGIASGIIYSGFTGALAPKINTIVNTIKGKFEKR